MLPGRGAFRKPVQQYGPHPPDLCGIDKIDRLFWEVLSPEALATQPDIV